MLERQYPADLRNRVVGARLEKDGKLPYAYAWHPADGPRYFDISNQNTGSGFSNITASPFFHQLFIPLFELPQQTVSRIWLGLQYFFLACLIGMTGALTGDKKIKWMILNVGILFTATEAWKDMIATGQLYFFEGFLMGFILFSLIINKKTTIVIAGIIAAVFTLTRPIGIVMFIPFLFQYKKYLLFLGVSFAALAVYGVFVLANPYQKALYRDYVHNMKRHVQMHQQEGPEAETSHAMRTSPYPILEGFDMNEVHRLNTEYPIRIYSENGNIFVIYNKLTHSKLPLAVLNACSVATILILSLWFYIHNRKYPVQDLQIALFGFTLYMIVELFNPIHRHQYNTVQWFSLVLAGFLLITGWRNGAFILLILGLLLNITNVQWLPMRHLIGEFCWLTAMLMLVFSSRFNQPVWKKPS